MAEPTQFAAPHSLKSDLAASGGASAVSYGTDDGFIVTFREDTEFMEYLSKQAGYPIYRTRIMTNMIAPGNTKTVWDHPTVGIRYEMAVDPESGEVHTTWEVMDETENGAIPEPLRYPKAWNRFLRKSVASQDGTPIEEWGAITKSYAASLKAMNIHTVEALAALSDSNAQNIMGAIKYRDLAKAYLDERQKIRIVAKEQELRNRAEEEAADLRRQVKELVQTVATLQAAQGAGTPAPLPGVRNTGMEAAAIPGQLKSLSRAKAKTARKGPPKSDDAPVETVAA
jgi:hypothetical protein